MNKSFLELYLAFMKNKSYHVQNYYMLIQNNKIVTEKKRFDRDLYQSIDKDFLKI